MQARHLLDKCTRQAMMLLRRGSARPHIAQWLRPRLGHSAFPSTQPLIVACAALYGGTTAACLLCVPLRQPRWRRGAHNDTDA